MQYVVLGFSCRGRCFCPSCHQKRASCQGWAALIRQVYEADPLCSPRCGAELKIIAFIERHQTGVLEKILRHCGWWDEPSARAPPSAKISVPG